MTTISEWDNGWLRPTMRSMAKDAAEKIPFGGTVLDVGGNTGMFTEELVALVECNVFLFEPVRAYADHCSAKFRDRRNVVVERCALSDENGEITIYKDAENLGWNTIIKERADGMTPEAAPAIRFDDYAKAKGISRIDYIKIDTEGAEYKVLGGMLGTLKSLPKLPLIVCEVGWGVSHPYWEQEKSIFTAMFDIGYKPFSFDITHTQDVAFEPR
jgi:FkbM family methyltransferase